VARRAGRPAEAGGGGWVADGWSDVTLIARPLTSTTREPPLLPTATSPAEDGAPSTRDGEQRRGDPLAAAQLATSSVDALRSSPSVTPWSGPRRPATGCGQSTVSTRTCDSSLADAGVSDS